MTLPLAKRCYLCWCLTPGIWWDIAITRVEGKNRELELNWYIIVIYIYIVVTQWNFEFIVIA